MDDAIHPATVATTATAAVPHFMISGYQLRPPDENRCASVQYSHHMTHEPAPKHEVDINLARILWAALFASTLVYIVVLELTTAQANVDWQPLAMMFAFGGAGAAGASLIAPRFVKRSSGAYLVALILALALAESVCILGLVLGFWGAPPSVVMPFFVVTWVLMVIRFPTKERIDAFDKN